MVTKKKSAPVIFEPPCIFAEKGKQHLRLMNYVKNVNIRKLAVLQMLFSHPISFPDRILMKHVIFIDDILSSGNPVHFRRKKFSLMYRI